MSNATKKGKRSAPAKVKGRVFVMWWTFNGERDCTAYRTEIDARLAADHFREMPGYSAISIRRYVPEVRRG